MRTTLIGDADLTHLFGVLDPATEATVRQTLMAADRTAHECVKALTGLEQYRWRINGLSLYQGSGGRVAIDTYLVNHASCLEEELTLEFELSTAGANVPAPEGAWTLHAGVFVDGVFSQELAATLIEETYTDPVAAAHGLLDALQRLRRSVDIFPQSGEAWQVLEPGEASARPPFLLPV